MVRISDRQFLRHIGIVVSNLDQALRIYCEFLGLEIKAQYANHSSEYLSRLVNIKEACIRVAILSLPDNNRIELIEYLSNRKKLRHPMMANDLGYSHFAITVTNITDLYNKSKHFDVRFLSEPLLNPDGSAKVAFAIIMNEYMVELVEVLNESARFSGGE